MNDVSRAKATGARRLRVAGVAAAQQPALRQQLGPRRAMDCTVDAAAAEQARVRGVDDGVDALLRDVAADGLDHIGKLALTESESEHRTGACRAARVGKEVVGQWAGIDHGITPLVEGDRLREQLCAVAVGVAE